MARDYVSIREEHRGKKTLWTFSTVGPIRLKSAPGHVARRANGRYVIKGAAWGAPIARVEVQIDNGPWHVARIDRPDPILTRRMTTRRSPQKTHSKAPLVIGDVVVGTPGGSGNSIGVHLCPENTPSGRAPLTWTAKCNPHQTTRIS